MPAAPQFSAELGDESLGSLSTRYRLKARLDRVEMAAGRRQSAFGADVVVVDDVAFDLLDVLNFEPRFCQQLARLLFPPHVPQTLALECERNASCSAWC